ncbi:MAG: hypothetical protein R2752_18175 [Vicinamibacterales bacterium]
MNRALWPQNAMRFDAPYEQLEGAVMWGAGGNAQGPKVPPGTYTVKVSSGGWSQSQTFTLRADPRYQPEMTPEEGQQQLRIAREVGGWIKVLYDDVRTMRDLKSQADKLVENAPNNATVARAATALRDRLTSVEGDITQLQGEGGQDSLNFPGRMDNQLIVLYSNVVGPERRLGTPAMERYDDLKPEATALIDRANTAIKEGVTEFNAVATKAGLAPLVIK